MYLSYFRDKKRIFVSFLFVKLKLGISFFPNLATRQNRYLLD